MFSKLLGMLSADMAIDLVLPTHLSTSTAAALS